MTATGMFSEHEALAAHICNVLDEKKYKIEVFDINTQEEMSFFRTKVNPENCQMILNLDMTGYQFLGSRNMAIINWFQMNIVNYIVQPVEIFDGYLQKHISYMTSFAFASKEDFEKAKRQYPNLWHIDYCPSLERDLSSYLKEMEWRF